jgi:amino acid transporter
MSVATAASKPASSSDGGEDKGLKGGAIGLLSTTVIAISSTAPAYSLAAALGFIVIIPGMGFHAPGVILLAFVPMILVAQGYNRLNKEIPDCGTTFTWGAKTFGPITGWLGGWAIFAADVIVMANLAAVAGQYMFKLFGADGLAASNFWTTFAGIAWIIVMCAICYIGIEISTRIQYTLLVIEIIMLMLMSVVALVKVYNGSAPHAAAADIKAKTIGAGAQHVAGSWFNPFGTSFSAMMAGLLLAVFIYWGWDTAVSVNEETKDKSKTPGRAAVLATIVLLVTYLLVAVSSQAFAGLGTHGIGLANGANSGDVLSVLGTSIFGSHGFGWFLAKLLVFMVLTSSMASTLTTILPTARTTLSMAVYKAIPSKFASIHAKYLTPTWSTVGMGVISIVFYVLMAAINTNVLTDMIDAIGFPIAFYYALTGYECVWWYRKRLFDDVKTFFGAGVFPLVGALMLTGLFLKACFYYWHPVNSYTSFDGTGTSWLTGLGCLALGAVLMLIWRAFRPAYFRGETLNKDTPVLVPDE